MKYFGHNETGRDAPKSEQVRNAEIKENVRALLYALDSIPDEYFADVIRIVGFVGETTGRTWAGKVDV